jgi:hypothetical protein
MRLDKALDMPLRYMREILGLGPMSVAKLVKLK